MKKSLVDDIMSDFDPKAPEGEDSLRDRRPVTIWVSASAKARYDRLQEISRRRFGKKARELLLAAIDLAEGRAS